MPLRALMVLYSGDKILLNQLHEILSDSVYGSTQWSDQDFAPIEKVLDTYFASKGWKP